MFARKVTTMPNPVATFVKFHQFSKLEDSKEKDGAPTVWGVATWEQPDSDNEMCDYETAKPVYQAWSAKAFKRTSGAGQEPSLGNIRLQHGSEVGGKATKLEFDDKAKEIWLGSEPLNDEIKGQLKAGFYTGYSQGGSYAWRACADCEGQMPMQQGYNFCENCGKNVNVRYGLKRIAEVSYVDSPATGEGFEHVKANGSIEILKFAKKENSVAKTKRVAGEDLESSAFAYVGDPEKTDTWKFPIKFKDAEKTKRHIRNALARLNQAKGIPSEEKEKVEAKIKAAATAHGIDVNSDKSVKIREMLKAHIDKTAESKGLEKGLYMVARAADMLESLACLWEQAVWEREIEGDDSDVPDEIKEMLDSFTETFIAMATEEARELSAKKTDKPGAIMTPEEQQKLDLEKAAKKSRASHFAKASSHHEKLKTMHENLADEHEEAAEIHTKADVGCKDCMGKSDAAKAEAVKVAKAAAEAKGEVYKVEVGDGADHGDIHEVLANQQEFHKGMAKCEMAKAKHHDKVAAAHGKLADAFGKMAEGEDDESAKATKAEIVAFDLANPEPVVTKTDTVTKEPTMDEAVKKAAEAARNTPEYKDAIAAIAKAQVDAEVAKLRDTTLAPLGIKIDETTGKAILKDGIRAVPRDGADEAFKLAKTETTSTHAGL